MAFEDVGALAPADTWMEGSLGAGAPQPANDGGPSHPRG
jgi:hypothetical protein